MFFIGKNVVVGAATQASRLGSGLGCASQPWATSMFSASRALSTMTSSLCHSNRNRIIVKSEKSLSVVDNRSAAAPVSFLTPQGGACPVSNIRAACSSSILGNRMAPSARRMHRWFSTACTTTAANTPPSSGSGLSSDSALTDVNADVSADVSAADQLIIEEQNRQRREYNKRKNGEQAKTTTSVQMVEDATQNKYSGINAVFLHRPSAVERVLLVVALKYFPREIPERVERGVMNATWSRIRILGACLAWGYLLYWLEMSIRSGREARDGGDMCLYEDVDTSVEQAAKRVATADREASPVPIVAQLWKDTKRVITKIF